jgi:tripartite-type tricarboxylate transporter receptor subunit TctC
VGSAHAEYPEKTIRIVVPYPPGGFNDTLGRIVAQKLTEAWGQPAVVENRPGGGTLIGTDAVAKAPPDGYTLVMVSTTHVISPHLYKTMQYDALKDFTPVMKLAEGPYVLVVNQNKLAVRNVQELIAAAKAKPNSIDYASSGNGSSQHLVGALFCSMAGAPMNHVPYRGSSQAMNDLLGGTVPVSFVGVPNALSSVKSGRLRALAVSTAKRYPDMPDVPSLDEAGVKGFDATIWLGLLAPPGTPRDIVDKLNAAITKVLNEPAARKLMSSAGVDVATSTPEAFATLLKSEYDRWGKVVQQTGATVN